MDIASILLILAVAVLVALFIARPFLEAKPAIRELAADPLEKQHSSLLAERDRLLTALQELEFDQALEKIPAEDYPIQRAELLQAGAEIYRKLDALEQADTVASAEERLEAAVAARRADAARHATPVAEKPDRLPTAAAAPSAAPADELEALIASRRAGRLEKSAGFCPGCGSPVQKSDKFCPRCGKTL